MSDQDQEQNAVKAGKPAELHEIIERRLLAPYRVALLL